MIRVKGIQRVTIVTLLSPLTVVAFVPLVQALPPQEDIPEEVLRTQIILDARSPIDGRPMTPVEYAELQTQEQAPFQPPARLSPKVRSTVGLLKIRRFVKKFLPFIPIK